MVIKKTKITSLCSVDKRNENALQNFKNNMK